MFCWCSRSGFNRQTLASSEGGGLLVHQESLFFIEYVKNDHHRRKSLRFSLMA
jgi:hypothetical protein